MVSPKSAAHDFYNRQVQFTATGIFNKPPTRVAPFPVAWVTFPNTTATIDSNGLAQCARSGQVLPPGGRTSGVVMFFTLCGANRPFFGEWECIMLCHYFGALSGASCIT